MSQSKATKEVQEKGRMNYKRMQHREKQDRAKQQFHGLIKLQQFFGIQLTGQLINVRQGF